MPEYQVSGLPAPLLGVPVGTVIAFVGALNTLSPEWQPCDGRTINDPSSPFNGKKTPLLMNDSFIMGVSAASAVGQPGGSNVIPSVGAHAHGGRTDVGGHTNWSPGSEFDIGSHVFNHTHGITTDAQGAHDHGGENRPWGNSGTARVFPPIQTTPLVRLDLPRPSGCELPSRGQRRDPPGAIHDHPDGNCPRDYRRQL
jgi:hypothetical protein